MILLFLLHADYRHTLISAEDITDINTLLMLCQAIVTPFSPPLYRRATYTYAIISHYIYWCWVYAISHCCQLLPLRLRLAFVSQLSPPLIDDIFGWYMPSSFRQLIDYLLRPDYATLLRAAFDCRSIGLHTHAITIGYWYYSYIDVGW